MNNLANHCTNKYVVSQNRHKSALKSSKAIALSDFRPVRTIVPAGSEVVKPIGKPLRARYFKVFRPERTAMKHLENVFSRTFNRKEYRANRYLYFKVLPRLAQALSLSIDRIRLKQIEVDLWNQILSYKFQRGSSSQVKRLDLRRYQMYQTWYNNTMNQQKL